VVVVVIVPGDAHDEEIRTTSLPWYHTAPEGRAGPGMRSHRAMVQLSNSA
jgi:hypothetical protein